MSSALQIALFLACVALVLLVSLLIPLSILLYRRTSGVVRQLEEMKTDLKQLIHDSRAMVQNVSLLSSRANQQLDDLGNVVRVVRRWSERVDHVVEEFGAAVESPVLKMARRIKMLRQIWGLIVSMLAEDSQPVGHKAGEPGGPKK